MRETYEWCPKIGIMDLLKRRKTDLGTWLREGGITCYSELVHRCDRLGARPITEEEYKKHVPEQASKQTEGVIVLAPAAIVIDNPRGEVVDATLDTVLSDPSPEQPQEPSSVPVNGNTKRRKKSIPEEI